MNRPSPAQRDDPPPFSRTPGRRLGAGRAGHALDHGPAANADDLKRRHKAAILLWMGGGPATIDIWDLKPGAPTGGTFKPIGTSGDEQICEHLPLVAKQMQHLAIVRSMSTREADHNRGRYYMHTGYVPNPNIEHPSYGSVISHMLADQIKQLQLEIPPFVAVGGGSVGPGFLGMTYAPFVVNSDGNVRNLKMRRIEAGPARASGCRCWPRSKKASSSKTAANRPRITPTSSKRPCR